MRPKFGAVIFREKDTTTV